MLKHRRTSVAILCKTLFLKLFMNLRPKGNNRAHMLKIYEGHTESHEQLFLHANWEQQMKESAVVDGTS